MKIFKAFALLAVLAGGAYATTISVCNSGCTYTPANVQTALTNAACGDTITIQHGVTMTGHFYMNQVCAAGNEVTVITDSSTWLPDADMRITPAYAPLLPKFRLTAQDNSSIFVVGDTAGGDGFHGTGASGIKLVGLTFEAASSTAPSYTGTYYIIQLAPYYPASAADLVDNFTLDRSILRTAGLNYQVHNGIVVNSKKTTVINNFFENLHQFDGSENHALISSTALGPFYIGNNYSGYQESEHFFFGGNQCCQYQDSSKGKESEPMAHDVVLEHNFMHNSLMFYPGNPNYIPPSTFGLANMPCMKNFFETKQADRVITRYNSGEYQWGNCQSQYWGMTFTPRVAINYTGATGAASLDASSTTVTLTSDPDLPFFPYKVGMGIGLPAVGNVGAQCANSTTVVTGLIETHIVTGVSASSLSITVDQPFTKTCASSGMGSFKTNAPWATGSHIESYGNHFKNTPQGWLISGFDNVASTTPNSTSGYSQNIAIHDNIFSNSSPYMAIGDPLLTYPITFFDGTVWNFGPPWVGQTSLGSNTSRVEHNTFYKGPNLNVQATYNRMMYQMSVPYGSNNFKYRNNLAPYGDYGVYGADGSGGDKGGIQSYSTNNAEWSYNSFLGWNTTPIIQSYEQPCTGIPGGSFPGDGTTYCFNPTGFFATTNTYNYNFVNPAMNDFTLNYTTSPLKNAGSDGKDVGADTNNVVLIKYLTVQPGANALLFRWILNPFMSGMGCNMEVSADAGLVTDVSTYTVVNALRPDYYIRATSDRSNPLATYGQGNTSRFFQVGSNTSTTGDDGISHYIGLAPSTTYYYRIMCGGATEVGSAQTLASNVTNQSTIQIKYKSTAAKARVRYGTKIGSLTTGAAVACTSGCTLTATGNVGDQLIYYVDETDSGGTPTYTSTAPSVAGLF